MIQSIVILIGGAVLITVLLRFKGATEEDLDQTQLAEVFKDFDLRVLLGFFLFIPMYNSTLAYLFSELSIVEFSTEPRSEFIIRPTGKPWFFISLMFSLVASLITMIHFVKWTRKEQAGSYWKYYNLKYGFNATGFLKYFSVLIVLIATLLGMSQMNSYVKFREGSIGINQSLDFQERAYAMADISEITYYQKADASKAQADAKSHYGIVFRDGFVWKTNDDLRTPKMKDEKIFSWLLKQTNLELNKVTIGQ